MLRVCSFKEPFDLHGAIICQSFFFHGLDSSLLTGPACAMLLSTCTNLVVFLCAAASEWRDDYKCSPPRSLFFFSDPSMSWPCSHLLSRLSFLRFPLGSVAPGGCGDWACLGLRAAAKVVVVGGGAGGVELALAMQYRLKELFREAGRDPDMVVVEIVNRGEMVLSSHNRFVN